jgi:hypothetical protein
MQSKHFLYSKIVFSIELAKFKFRFFCKITINPELGLGISCPKCNLCPMRT